MKNGFWNYSEPINWRVLLVTLHAVADPKLHWQNAFVGEERQVVEITHQHDGQTHTFYIDNADGSGILKIEAGGGPASMSRHVEGFDLILEVGEDHYQLWNPTICKLIDQKVEVWQALNWPDEFAKLQALKTAWITSPFNPNNLTHARKN